MDFQLNKRSFNQLRSLQKRERNTRRYKKITSLLMLHQKHSIPAIESALGIDDNTIYSYVERYQNSDNIEAYLQDGYVGCTSKLSDAQELELAAHLDEHLYATSKEICKYIEQTTGVEYSISGITKLLHRLGFSYKLSTVVPGKAEEELQVAFLEEKLPQLMEEVQAKKAVIYYADGCHPTHNTKSSKGWIRKGQEFEVKSNSGRRRVNINAALNALKPEHIVFETTDTINAQSTLRICQKLMKKHRKEHIYYICDNARYNRNKMLQEWAQDKRITFIYLPAYSPNLNLIERLWRHMRKHIIASVYYDTYSKFKEAIETYLENPKTYKEELRSLLTMNFQTIGGTSVYSRFVTTQRKIIKL